ncbi:hypothetical protein [Olivibacter sitiensis]|uniref:hypothetical protein n=1 Tax=Olivibacter sitiensis TaxID=376470 RepID=UPI00048600D2|nr:hypothetical protein [Olivibacter sitiensis]
MLPFTQTSLDKLERLLLSLGFKVRYEKGNFRTGSCVIQHSKVVVVNKFSNMEVKINSLVNLINGMEIDQSLLDDKQKQLLYSIKQTKLTL